MSQRYAPYCAECDVFHGGHASNCSQAPRPIADPAVYLHVGMNCSHDTAWWEKQVASMPANHDYNVSARHGGYAGWYMTGPGGHVLVRVTL